MCNNDMIQNKTEAIMKYPYLLFAMVTTCLAAPPLSADEAASGQAIAFTCAGCHGPEGRSQGVAPALDGEEAEDLYEILIEYKTDEEEGTIMNRIAKGYSDEELRAVAEYYSKVED